MVKGVSRQVILVQSPDPKLFEQAIFILKDDAVSNGGITDELLLKEAKRIISASGNSKRKKIMRGSPLWAALGAAVTGLIWGLTVVF